VKRENPSAAQDRILMLVSAATGVNGMRSSEIEAASGMTTGEVRMATRWLAENGYLDGTKRIVRFNFGHQGFANKPVMFWRLTDKGSARASSACPVASAGSGS
jgi:predicted transcriptional regulator